LSLGSTNGGIIMNLYSGICHLCASSFLVGVARSNHLAIAKAAGYEKWFNAAEADITTSKVGDI
jgi:hypothetical protein